MTLQEVTRECGEFKEMVCTAVGPNEVGAPGPELAAGCRFRAWKSALRRSAALMGTARHRVPRSRRCLGVRHAHTARSQSEASAREKCVLIPIADRRRRCTLSGEATRPPWYPRTGWCGLGPPGRRPSRSGLTTASVATLDPAPRDQEPPRSSREGRGGLAHRPHRKGTDGARKKNSSGRKRRETRRAPPRTRKGRRRASGGINGRARRPSRAQQLPSGSARSRCHA